MCITMRAELGNERKHRVLCWFPSSAWEPMGWKLQFPEERPSMSLQEKGSQAGVWKPPFTI